MTEEGGGRKKTRVDAVDYLRSLPTIRERTSIIFEAAKKDKLKHFSLAEDKLPAVVDYVLDVINLRFPEGVETVPFHSRFRHFEPGGIDRVAELKRKWPDLESQEIARRLVDLVMVSVLLDAGAGDAWKYQEASSDQTFSRSEGLGIASFHMFVDGAFSSSDDNKYRADSAGLKALTVEKIREGFQVDDEKNPLVGDSGRAELLQRLGSALELHPEYFGDATGTVFRPGHLVDFLFQKAENSEVSVHELWKVLMYGLESIWPAGRSQINGKNLGDVWPHSALPKDPNDESSGYVPFHKLSQWLGYSLLEPLIQTGLNITDTKHMTGLPEYRNGGLFVDLGVLVPKYPEILTEKHRPDSEMIVEWRALTVMLLDEVGNLLREKVGATEESLPLVKILEGGTWTAGRKIAKELRPDTCGPPISIISDGTVF